MTTNTISVLNDLIKTSKDGEQGFRNAAEHVTDLSLKNIFLEKADGCRHAAHELQQHVVQRNGEPENSGSFFGAIHRGWMNLKSAVTQSDDHAILEECERGEDEAKRVYSQALQEDLPVDVRTLIQHQYNGVIANHNQIRALRDQHVSKK